MKFKIDAIVFSLSGLLLTLPVLAAIQPKPSPKLVGSLKPSPTPSVAAVKPVLSQQDQRISDNFHSLPPEFQKSIQVGIDGLKEYLKSNPASTELVKSFYRAVIQSEFNSGKNILSPQFNAALKSKDTIVLNQLTIVMQVVVQANSDPLATAFLQRSMSPNESLLNHFAIELALIRKQVSVSDLQNANLAAQRVPGIPSNPMNQFKTPSDPVADQNLVKLTQAIIKRSRDEICGWNMLGDAIANDCSVGQQVAVENPAQNPQPVAMTQQASFPVQVSAAAISSAHVAGP